MNKRLLTLSMVGLLTMTVTSCSDVSSKTVDGKQVIVTVGDEAYTADDLLAKYGTTSSGVNTYYNAIYDVLIRDQQTITADIQTTVSKKIDDFTTKVKSDASTNGVTYKTELSNQLEEAGVESLAELSEVYTLEQQKTKYEEDWYSNRINWEDDKDELTADYITTANPYHIRHILVKAASAGTSLYKGTISEEEAIKLSSVVKRLASGTETFGQVAQQASEDTSSAALYGSVGIMDRDTSFVSEFKYGIYAYDAYFDTHASNNAISSADRKARLNIPETISYSSSVTGSTKSVNVEDQLKTIAEVPYQVIEDLEKYADKTNTEGNITYVPNAGEALWNGTDPKNVASLGGQAIDENYYPRNIIFNNYFNDHGLYVITDEGLPAGADTSRFKSFPNVSTHNILCDEDGNPILVTRAGSGDSYQGVHFMIIEQSPFWYDEASLSVSKELTTKREAASKTGNPSTEEYLRYYYSTSTPDTSSEDVSDNQKYVTFIKSNRTTYTDRADAIEKAVKAYDANVSYKIFETLYTNAKSKITIDEKVLSSIQDMIAQKRASTSYTLEQSNISSWKSYVELLQLQDAEKEVKQLDLQFIKMYDSAYEKTTVKTF